MLIDWFTVAAQALNLLILIFLLQRFLYKPILSAIDARETRIAAALADAAAKQTEATKERDDLQHRNDDFDSQRAALLGKATEDAAAVRQRLLNEARSAADALGAARELALQNDSRTLHQAITLRTRDEVFAIARKTLSDLATAGLEERIADVFTRRLREMDAAAKAVLSDTLKASADPALLRSTFDLPAEQRATIQNALNETCAAEIRITFETAPDLISGIELTTQGEKVGWSIAGYLGALEKAVDELLGRQAAPEIKGEPILAAKAA